MSSKPNPASEQAAEKRRIKIYSAMVVLAFIGVLLSRMVQPADHRPVAEPGVAAAPAEPAATAAAPADQKTGAMQAMEKAIKAPSTQPQSGSASMRRVMFASLDCAQKIAPSKVTMLDDANKEAVCGCVQTQTGKTGEVEGFSDFEESCKQHLPEWIGQAQQEVRRPLATTSADEEKELMAIPDQKRVEYRAICEKELRDKAKQLAAPEDTTVELNGYFLRQCILNQAKGGAAAPTAH